MNINKMGIELEGAWTGTPRGTPPFADKQIKHDGSVNFSQNAARDPWIHYGEMISDPLDPEALVAWAVEHCPTLVNNTCGTHIHVSLKSLPLYASLMTPAFNKYLMNSLYEYNETIAQTDRDTYYRFKSRLNGNNRYCKKGFKGLHQAYIDHKGGERYRQLNFCFSLHGTVEIRVLPATKNKEFLAGCIRLVTEAIEEWTAKEHRCEKVRFRRR